MMYQICVRGRLTERMAAALEGMTLQAGAFDTVFTGEVKDQSQLYGLLNRLLDLGLELISVQPQTDEVEQATTTSSQANLTHRLP